MPNKTSVTDAALRELRAFGLTYPGAHTKSPWPGHLDLAVNDKTFAYLSVEGEPFKLSCKLPHTGDQALMLPGTSPTPYGLGKSGWVTSELPADEAPPVEIFKAWIDESYRAQAPKKLVKQLSEGGAEASTPARPAQPRGAARKRAPAAKKTQKKSTTVSARSRVGAAGSGTRRTRA
jgi:hypothetical protein